MKVDQVTFNNHVMINGELSKTAKASRDTLIEYNEATGVVMVSTTDRPPVFVSPSAWAFFVMERSQPERTRPIAAPFADQAEKDSVQRTSKKVHTKKKAVKRAKK